MKTLVTLLLITSAAVCHGQGYHNLPGGGTSATPYRAGHVFNHVFRGVGLGYFREVRYYEFTITAQAQDEGLIIDFDPSFQGGYNLDLYQGAWHIGGTSYLTTAYYKGYRQEINSRLARAVLPLPGLPAGTYKVALSRSNDFGYSTDYDLRFYFPSSTPSGGGGGGGGSGGGGSVTLGSTSRSIGAAEFSGSLMVEAPSNVSWSATSSASWLRVTGPTGTTSGSGSVRYTASANPATSSRSASIVVAGKTFTLTQAGAASNDSGGNGGGGNGSGTSKPAITTSSLPVVSVGQKVSLTLAASHQPQRFRASGLPAGLKLDPSTGVISGVPTTARMTGGEVAAYRVTLSATNSAGMGDAVVLEWRVQPLDARVSGVYECLVDPNTALNGAPGSSVGFGGKLTLKVTSRGAVSGRLRLGAASYPVKSMIEIQNPGASPRAEIRIARASAPALVMNLVFDLSKGEIKSSLGDGANTADVIGYKALADVRLAGNHNMALVPEGRSAAAVPGGFGFAVCKVQARGTVTCAGKLADGSTLTASGPLLSGALWLGFQMLHSNTGSLWGWTLFGEAGAQAEGGFAWVKNSSTRPAPYSQGFATVLQVTGGRYVKPVPGERLLNLGGEGWVTFASGGLGQTLAQSLSLTPAFAARVPANSNQVKLSLNAASGLFQGSFTVPASTPGEKARQARFHGMLVPGLEEASGLGFFLLPQAAGNSQPLSGMSALW